MVILLLMIFALAFFLGVIPSLVKWEIDRKILKFYNTVKVGDKFYDPYYMDDPFKEDMKIFEVIGKKDGYIQYKKFWENKESGKRSQNYYEETESRPVETFYYEVEKYYR